MTWDWGRFTMAMIVELESARRLPAFDATTGQSSHVADSEEIVVAVWPEANPDAAPRWFFFDVGPGRRAQWLELDAR
jgi:hypothetical protein